MRLMMYLGNDLLEAVPILREDLRNPGYLGKFKRYLKKKYEETINQFNGHPEFLIDTDPVKIPEPKK